MGIAAMPRVGFASIAPVFFGFHLVKTVVSPGRRRAGNQPLVSAGRLGGGVGRGLDCCRGVVVRGVVDFRTGPDSGHVVDSLSRFSDGRGAQCQRGG